MIIFYYKPTFEGLLCSLFDAYKRKEFPDQILPLGEIAPLFVSSIHTVEITTSKTQRVWHVLQKKLSHIALQSLIRIWIAHAPQCVDLLFRYLCKVVDSKHSIETKFTDNDVLALRKLNQKIQRERHRIMMFVRFTSTLDKIYFATISPEYNVLPLVTSHFQDRFSCQKWIIYDEVRQYGYFYNEKNIVEITLDDARDFLCQGQVNPRYRDSIDTKYVSLWQEYFTALSIKERTNLRLQKRNMPVRYWKYLPEMQIKNCNINFKH